MAGCGPAVRGAWGASGAGLAGFRRAGQYGQRAVDVTETPADPGGGQPAGRAGPLPGQADVGGEAAGEVQLGVGGDDQPGPPVGGGGVADLRGGPSQDLLEQAKGMFQVKAAQERLPGAVQRVSGGDGCRG